jgi:hypothetical protein
MNQLTPYFLWWCQNRTQRVRNPPKKFGRSFAAMYFFSSSAEAITEWFKGKGYDPIILSIQEGFQLDRMTFEEVLKYA